MGASWSGPQRFPSVSPAPVGRKNVPSTGDRHVFLMEPVAPGGPRHMEGSPEPIDASGLPYVNQTPKRVKRFAGQRKSLPPDGITRRFGDTFEIY